MRLNLDSPVWQPLIELLALGGPVVWLLAVLLLISLTLAVLKVGQLFWGARGVKAPAQQALMHWQQGQAHQAITLLANQRQPCLQVLAFTLQGLHQDKLEESLLREEISRQFAQHQQQLLKGLKPIEMVANISPLLGLLGTVLGMITAFQQMAQAGHQIDPSLLSSGIWQALLTTAVGLIVAIPLVLLHGGLEQWIQRQLQQLEDWVSQGFTLCPLCPPVLQEAA